LLIRIADIVISIVGILFLSPLFLLTAISIKVTSPGAIFFLQERVGRYEKKFFIIKFRTMYQSNNKNQSLLTTYSDLRITIVGKKLRKYKIDELPQLFNVLIGHMSIVGPRPEVEYFTNFYSYGEKKILFSVRPGLTDFSTIFFINEEEILNEVENVDKFYIENILPKKIKLSKIYAQKPSLYKYLYIILLTLNKLFHRK
jgi:lipopolysaccharide/colanic/teichoic acid biosynthesis glycosyltransferase